MAASSLPPSGYWQRIVYIMMPLLLLLLFLGTINLWPEGETAVSPSTATPPATPTRPPLPTQTVPEQTTSPLPPTSPPPPPLPTGDISLLGPPAGSTFPINTPITLFWQWPHPLTAGQHFTVYWQQNGQTQQLGQLTESNFGDLFQLQTTPMTAGTALWWVVLESTSPILAPKESPQRPLLIAAQ